MGATDEAFDNWAFGVPNEPGLAGPHGAGFGSGSPGLLARLTEFYPGEPIGPPSRLVLAANPVGLTLPDFANGATVVVEGAAARVTFDGTAPTATIGLLLPPGTVLGLGGRGTLHGAQFFAAAAGAIVQATYWT